MDLPDLDMRGCVGCRDVGVCPGRDNRGPATAARRAARVLTDEPRVVKAQMQRECEVQAQLAVPPEIPAALASDVDATAVKRAQLDFESRRELENLRKR